MASKSRESYFSAYKAQSRWKSNRTARLQKQLKEHPGNAEQINLAIANMVYRRSTPNARVWSSGTREIAKLLKQFCGSAPLACFSSNPKVSAAALAALDNKAHQYRQFDFKVDFSLGFRATNPNSR